MFVVLLFVLLLCCLTGVAMPFMCACLLVLFFVVLLHCYLCLCVFAVVLRFVVLHTYFAAFCLQALGLEFKLKLLPHVC